ncbi:MAG: PIN domain-containing protein, partial [Deltaproteobacteria bacterium]|nr:PIN domain-containing protein [Deltaproteobacteria bacterium]
FLDTSVLTSAMISTHLHHEMSLRHLQRIQRKEVKGAISTHSLAECYANLTAYPISPRILPEIAERLIQENILSLFTVVELSTNDYRSAIERVRLRGLRSGAIFDALILQAAIKKKAEALLTWNTEDFTRLIPDGEIEILKP